MKNIYWFAYYNFNSPSVRYRAKYPLEYLYKKHGINSALIIPSYNPKLVLSFIITYISALFASQSKSIIVIQRVHSNFIYANLLKLLVKIKRNTVYDTDDADYLEIASESIFYFVKNCSAVMVGSNELVSYLSKFNCNVFLNTSPTPDLGIKKQNRNPVLRIGWIGGFGGDHKRSLNELLFPSITNLPFPIILTIAGVYTRDDYIYLKEYFLNFSTINLELPLDIDWNNEESIQKLISGFDIGIATLLDNEMHRSKSAFKLKQYLNNGIPVLSSDLKENNCFVKHGKNGFLCQTPVDFRNRIIEIQQMNDFQYNIISSEALKSTPEFNLEHYCSLLISKLRLDKQEF